MENVALLTNQAMGSADIFNPSVALTEPFKGFFGRQHHDLIDRVKYYLTGSKQI
jgi:hypothetical protein